MALTLYVTHTQGRGEDFVEFSDEDGLNGEIDVTDDNSGVSVFGSAHITVAEMIRRVQFHDELVEALRVHAEGGRPTMLEIKKARALLAKVSK